MSIDWTPRSMADAKGKAVLRAVRALEEFKGLIAQSKDLATKAKSFADETRLCNRQFTERAESAEHRG